MCIGLSNQRRVKIFNTESVRQVYYSHHLIDDDQLWEGGFSGRVDVQDPTKDVYVVLIHFAHHPQPIKSEIVDFLSHL